MLSRISPLVLGLVFLLGSCDDGTRSTQTAILAVDPAAFVFPTLPANQSTLRTVTISNRGSGDLVIVNLRLEDRSTAGEFSLLGTDGEILPERFMLEGGSEATIELQVHYQPTDDQPDDLGEVLAETNDPSVPTLRLPVMAGGQGPEIRAFPATINFENVEVGGRGDERLTISNAGAVELVVTSVAVVGLDFEVLRDGASIDSFPLVIAPGGTMEFTVAYTPRTSGPDSGELIFESNDAIVPLLTVPLLANGAAPCLAVSPSTADFGAALLVESTAPETPNRLPITISSCGTTALRVNRLELEDDTGVFRLINPPTGQGAPLIELPAAGEFEPSADLVVGFWPPQERTYGGRLKVHSNDPDSPRIIDLFGRGVQNACPVPIVAQSSLAVEPLDVITLDGSGSYDPGGQVTRWTWTVVSRPDGSVSQPMEAFADIRRPADGGELDVDATPTALFFVDLAGEYDLELKVYDNLGQVSCEPMAVARIHIRAVPSKDLHVQLVWSTPDDPDETDLFGTDVDLHFRHPRAGDAWGEAASGFDCYFANTGPDWGRSGVVEDNPSLDIDDTNGSGPENINLSEPEIGATYDIGAIYFRSESAFGVPEADPRIAHASFVTVRLFVRGELLAEFVDRELDTLRQLWWIARVSWCEDFRRCPSVEVIDRVFEEAQYAR